MTQALTMPREKRTDLTAKIDAGLLIKARTVASDRNISMAEYLSEVLRPHVERDYAKLGEKIVSENPKRKS